MMGSLVFCIHHKEGCKWSDELRKLKVRTESLIKKAAKKTQAKIIFSGSFEHMQI
jgi:hypothetical protein